MIMRITNKWLRSRIERDADLDTDAGLPITKAEVLQAFVSEKTPRTPPSPRAKAPASSAQPAVLLGILLRQLRRRDNLNIAQLAAVVRVPEGELRALEQDGSIVPRPRTIHQLAVHFKLPPRALLVLSPAAAERDQNLEKAAVRFAASSDDLSKLSRDERKRLNEFIKLLSEYKEHWKKNAD